MDTKDIAISLIRLVDAEVSDDNVAGVKKVLEAIVGSITADWEEYITDDTNALLAEDNVCCEECGARICVKRYRKVLYVLNS